MFITGIEMKVRIISDSSANLCSLDGVDFKSVPLRIVTDEKEYVDDDKLDTFQMVEELSNYKGRSGTACTGVGDWLEAFGDADEIYCVTISSALSGSYNAVITAKKQYEEEHPGKKIYVVDSLSAGPEMKLLVEKIREYVQAGESFDSICQKIEEHRENHTALIFCLESLKNLANNGRVNKAVATISGLIGIRVVGDASEEGQIRPIDKARGEKKAIKSIINLMKKRGYKGDSVVIDHCFNIEAAKALKEEILAEFKDALIRIEETTGLCCFYAEKGGLMVGYEV